MLITYIKEGTPAQIFSERGVCNDEGICYFLTKVIKFYWLMLLYPGELYSLLGASSWYESV
jgi:hypothetical protein